MKKLPRVDGIVFEEDGSFCGACVEGKQHRSGYYERQQCGSMDCNSIEPGFSDRI